MSDLLMPNQLNEVFPLFWICESSLPKMYFYLN